MINNKVPKRRFKGFTDDWEQRTLDEVADYRNGKAHENDIDETGKFVVVNSKFVSTDGNVKKHSNRQNEPLFENEIAFVLSDVPNGKAIAKTFLIDKSGKYTLNQRIAGIKHFNNIDPKFLSITMNRNKYFLQFDDGAKQTNLSLNDMKKYTNYYPKQNEQEQIGSFFKELDSLITLHQRKLNKLEDLKLSYLEKMFPQNNETVPEYRFKGFTDDWEQRKLENIFIKGGSGGTPTSTNKNYYGGNIPFLGIADITNSNGKILKTDKYISKIGLDNSAAWLVPKGSISLAMYASVGKLGILNIEAATSQAFYNMVFDDNDIRDFVYHRLYKTNIDGEWIKYISTGTQDNLNAEKVKNFSFKLPTLNLEIKKISSFFNELDSLITLHQCKLNKLKNLKQAYLNEMFVI